MKTDLILGAILNFLAVGLAQRVAPGVPPQHYQPQHNPGGHQQHVPVQHHQQVPVQPQFQQQQQQQQQQHIAQPQQHVQQQQQQFQPQQQQQQHQNVPHQQVPHHDGHQSGHHNPQLLSPGNIAHEKEHIAEHMEVPMDTSKMSEQELQFHYFKMHDADNNNKLDGCELIKSLIHWHEQGSKHKQEDSTEHQQKNQIQEKIFADEELVGLIDPILSMDDGNKDGYIDYPEFVRAQQKAQAQQATKN